MEKIKFDKLIFDENKLKLTLEFEQVKEYFDINNDNPIVISKNNIIDYDEVKNKFEEIKPTNSRPNLYALCVKKMNSEWKIKYIGQRKCEGILTRLRQHLLDNNDGKTGSKLDNVKKELENDSEIGLILYKVYPDALRQYYEQKLIEHFKPGWNIQS